MRKSGRVTNEGASDSDPWGNSPCPKYVPRRCLKNSKLPQEHFPNDEDIALDLNYTIEKLQKLISDSVTKDNAPRLCRLLNDYLQEVHLTGYRLKHLPGIIKIFEFLTCNDNDVKEYETLINQMLEICCIPPLLETSSDSLNCIDVMQQYFILLGYLLAVVPLKEQFVSVQRALHSLISNKSRHNRAMLSHEICIQAMEQSELPVIIAELLEASFPPIYPHILDIVFLLASTSDLCCWKMLEAGALNTILIRMDLPYAIQSICTRPPKTFIEGAEYSETTTQLIMNTLWCLMHSLFPPKRIPEDLPKNLNMARCALWGLRYSFERHVCYAQNRANNMRIRNEIAVLLLMGLIKIPSWNLVQCGIAADVVKLVAMIEKGSTEILSQEVVFGVCKEELHFQKILLLIIAYLADVGPCRSLLVKANVMETILQIVNPKSEDFQSTRKASQFAYLSESALYALSMLAPQIPEEFIRHQGIVRLSMIMEWNVSEHFDAIFVSNCLRCVSAIILKADTDFLTSCRECGIVFSLLKLANHILEFKQHRMIDQQNLILILITIEAIMRNKAILQEMYQDQCITLAMRLLFKSLYQKDTDFHVDQRLFLAIGIFIWGCIVTCRSSLTKFIDYGAVYIILDILEIIIYPAQGLYLGLLTDMCDNIFCGVYLSTWRGIDKSKGLYSLLASIWREEEIRLDVQSVSDSSMKDGDLAQMGVVQWSRTYMEKPTDNISPAIIDMIGSTRSKIYSITKIIKRDSEKYELVREKYRILYDKLPVEDRITLASIKMYLRLKLGQVWTEVARYLDEIGIKPLGMDSQMISSLVQRYHSWGLFIKEQQNRMIQMKKTTDEIEEKDDYAKIKNSMLPGALDALDELNYILRTTDRNYMLQKKCIQRLTANHNLPFPRDIEDEHCHRTFQENINVTTIFGQHFTTASTPAFKEDEKEIRPVSPPGSPSSLTSLSPFVISSRSALLPDLCDNLEDYQYFQFPPRQPHNPQLPQSSSICSPLPIIQSAS